MPLVTATETAAKATEKKHWLDAWHVTPSANRDYDFIDGLRGVAILMVIAAHAFYFNPSAGFAVKLAGNVIGTGGYGVSLFFVLSGFLIAWPFWKRKVAASENVLPRGYFQRRFWKIYPPLALSILILTPLFIFVLNPKFGTSYIPVGLRWLSGIAFLFPVSGNLNPVMWTLVLEVQFYLLLPLAFFAFKRLSAKASLVGCTLVFLVLPMVYRLITKQAPTFQPDINSHFPSGLDSFYLGILIAGLDAMGVVKKSWKWWGVAGCVLWPLTLLVSGWINMHPDIKTAAVAELENDSLKIAAACLILFIAEPQHWLARLLCAPWLRWCGNIQLGAEIKLRHFDLWKEFETGAFADDSEHRDQIAAVARERGRRLLGNGLRDDEILVIGDTPLDIRCGRAIGAKVLAVATGGATLEELKRHEPDWAVADLRQVAFGEVIGQRA